MGTEQDLRRIAQLAAEAADKAAQGRTTGLAPLLEEMQALGEVLPGQVQPKSAEQIALDAEVEAGFDNMPV
ncbi:MAG: hypothetical protein ACK4HF_00775 [Paracoccaceae bacterium]